MNPPPTTVTRAPAPASRARDRRRLASSRVRRRSADSPPSRANRRGRAPVAIRQRSKPIRVPSSSSPHATPGRARTTLCPVRRSTSLRSYQRWGSARTRSSGSSSRSSSLLSGGRLYGRLARRRPGRSGPRIPHVEGSGRIERCDPSADQQDVVRSLSHGQMLAGGLPSGVRSVEREVGRQPQRVRSRCGVDLGRLDPWRVCQKPHLDSASIDSAPMSPRCRHQGLTTTPRPRASRAFRVLHRGHGRGRPHRGQDARPDEA